MTHEEYKKLNDYLNGCFIKLEQKDQFLLRNIIVISKYSDAFIQNVKDYDLNDEVVIQKLTFEDVYLLAREILASIDTSYLPIYDGLITSGELDFSYTNEYFDSHFLYNSSKNLELINVNRNFTYDDVGILVHEFMHKMNYKQKKTINRYLFTEFISIYFEEYSKRYLLNKGINKELLNLNERIRNTQKSASFFNHYSLTLLLYEQTGFIDDNSYKFLNEYYCPMTKEDYDKECREVLTYFETIEKKYRMKVMYEKEFDEDELYDELIKDVSTQYRYILGTIFAYYALKHCDKKDITHLSNHINDDKFADMSPIDCLEMVGIDLENIGIEEFMDIIKEQIEQNLCKKK